MYPISGIRVSKCLFAVSVFGAILTTAFWIRHQNRRKKPKLRKLQGKNLGDFELFEFGDIILPEFVAKSWRQIETFKFRADDVVLISFPKTGTTWLQEIVWLVANDLDFDAAKAKSIDERFPYLEFVEPGIDAIDALESPRFIKSHLTPKILFNYNNKDEESYAKLPKVLAVLRNPKDVVVSFYHFCRMLYICRYKDNFEQYFDRFTQGLVPYGPIWTHYLDTIQFSEYDATQPLKNRRLLIVFYEDLKRDFENQINRISDFLGKPRLNSYRMLSIKDHCSFGQMSLNSAVNYKHIDDLREENETKFMRKGEIGDWKRYFNSEREQIMNALISDKLGDKINFIYE